jgi:hypothetical protein
LNIKSDKNPLIESRVIPSEKTDGRMEGRKDRQTGRQTNMMKLIIAFRNLVKIPKNRDTFLNTISFGSITGKFQRAETIFCII